MLRTGLSPCFVTGTYSAGLLLFLEKGGRAHAINMQGVSSRGQALWPTGPWHNHSLPHGSSRDDV